MSKDRWQATVTRYVWCLEIFPQFLSSTASVLVENEPNGPHVEGYVVHGLSKLVELERIALDKIRQAAQNGLLIRARTLLFLPYRWREWAGEDEVRRWVQKTIVDDKVLSTFLEAFLSRHYKQTIPDKVGTEEYRLDKSLALFVDPSLIANRVKALLKSNVLSVRQRIATVLFTDTYGKSGASQKQNFLDHDSRLHMNEVLLRKVFGIVVKE